MEKGKYVRQRLSSWMIYFLSLPSCARRFLICITFIASVGMLRGTKILMDQKSRHGPQTSGRYHTTDSLLKWCILCALLVDGMLPCPRSHPVTPTTATGTHIYCSPGAKYLSCIHTFSTRMWVYQFENTKLAINKNEMFWIPCRPRRAGLSARRRIEYRGTRCNARGSQNKTQLVGES